jgi:hypothetical protein
LVIQPMDPLNKMYAPTLLAVHKDLRCTKRTTVVPSAGRSGTTSTEVLPSIKRIRCTRLAFRTPLNQLCHQLGKLKPSGIEDVEG